MKITEKAQYTRTLNKVYKLDKQQMKEVSKQMKKIY